MAGVIGLTTTVLFALIVASTLFFLKAYASSQKDILETNENDLKIGIAIILIYIYFVFLVLHGILILINKEYSSHERIIVSFIAFFPFMLGLFYFIAIKRYLRRLFFLKNPETILTKEDVDRVGDTVKKLSKDLGLMKSPRILISELDDISPFAFGTTSKRSYLALPKNFEEIFNKVSEGDNKVAETLQNFILIHELSHLKHRDHKFIGWAFYFLKFFKYWVATVMFLAILFSFILGLSFVKKILGPVNLGIFFYIVLYLLTLSISRNREYLADARASIFMSERDIKSITEKNVFFKGKRTSILERLFDYFDCFSWKTKILGVSCAIKGKNVFFKKIRLKLKKGRSEETLKKSENGIFNSHPLSNDRISKLKEKFFVEESTIIISRESAIWLGMMFGLLFAISFLYPNRTPIQIPPLFSPNYVFFKALKSSIETFGIWIFLFGVFLTPFLFYAKLKDSPPLAPNLFRHHLKIVERFLIIYGTFIVSSLFMIPFFHGYEKFLRFDFLVKFPMPYDPTTIILAAFLTTVLISSMHFAQKENMKISSSQRSVLKNSSTIIITIIAAVILFGALIGFGVLIASSSKPFLQKTFQLLQKGFQIMQKHLTASNLFCLGYGLIFTEFIYFYWTTKFPCIIDRLEGYTIYINRKNVLKTDWKGLDRMFLWRRRRYYLIIVVPIIFITFLLVSASYIYIYPLIGAFIGLMVYLFLKNKEIFRFSNISFDGYLKTICKYLFLLSTFNSGKILKNRDFFFKKLENFKLHDNSYTSHYLAKFGIVNTTFNAVCSVSFFQGKNYFKKSAEWVLNCENQEGGFSPVKGLAPRLSSTDEALSLLDRYSLGEKLNKEIHSNWIKSLQKKGGFFNDSISRFPRIEQTFFALHSLYFLGGIDEIIIRKCIDWVNKVYNDKKDFSSFYYSLRCLELVGELTPEIKKGVKKDFIIPNSQDMKNSRIEENLTDLYYFFKVAETVMEEDKDEIKALAVGLEERVYESFVNYLEKK